MLVTSDFTFLAHLSLTCSRGVFRVVKCLLYVVHHPSSTISLNISSINMASVNGGFLHYMDMNKFLENFFL